MFSNLDFETRSRFLCMPLVKLKRVNYYAGVIETLVQSYYFEIVFRCLQKPKVKFLNTFSNKYYHQNFLTSP